MFRKHEWVPAEGTIVEVRVEPGHGDPFMAPKVYVVDLRPSVGDPYRTEVPFTKHEIVGFYQPDPGEVTGFRIDPKSKKVEFDRTDPRNDADQRLAAADERLRQATARGHSQTALDDSGLSGLLFGAPPADPRKWIVPAECPNCGARVEQAVAELQDSPRCAYCEQPLPVERPPAPVGGLAALEALTAMGAVTQSAVGTAAHVLDVGEPVRATVVAAAPLPGIKNAAGLEVTSLTLSIASRDGTAAYQSRTGQHVPDAAQHLLAPGTVLPGKRMPDQAEGPVVIDWDAAMAGGAPAA